MTRFERQRQRGVVLIITMVLLFVLTFVVVLSMQNITLSERISFNYQQADIAFQAAETTIEQIFDLANPQNPNYTEATDPILTAIASGPYTVDYGHDQDASTPDHPEVMVTEVSATVTQNGAATLVEGFSTDFVNYPFLIRAEAVIDPDGDGLGLRDVHLQGVGRLAPNLAN